MKVRTMKKVKGISPTVPKLFYGAVLVAGIVLYVSWTALFLVPQGIWFDVGIFSLCIVMVLFGAAGYVLYGELEMRARRASRRR